MRWRGEERGRGSILRRHRGELGVPSLNRIGAGSGDRGSSVRPLTLACLALSQTREAGKLQGRVRTRPRWFSPNSALSPAP